MRALALSMRGIAGPVARTRIAYGRESLRRRQLGSRGDARRRRRPLHSRACAVAEGNEPPAVSAAPRARLALGRHLHVYTCGTALPHEGCAARAAAQRAGPTRFRTIYLNQVPSAAGGRLSTTEHWVRQQQTGADGILRARPQTPTSRSGSLRARPLARHLHDATVALWQAHREVHRSASRSAARLQCRPIGRKCADTRSATSSAGVAMSPASSMRGAASTARSRPLREHFAGASRHRLRTLAAHAQHLTGRSQCFAPTAGGNVDAVPSGTNGASSGW